MTWDAVVFITIYFVTISGAFLTGLYFGKEEAWSNLRKRARRLNYELNPYSTTETRPKPQEAQVGVVKAPSARDLYLKNTPEGQTEQVMKDTFEQIMNKEQTEAEKNLDRLL